MLTINASSFSHNIKRKPGAYRLLPAKIALVIIYSSEFAANMTRDIYKYYFHLEDEDDIVTGTAEVPDADISGGD